MRNVVRGHQLQPSTPGMSVALLVPGFGGGALLSLLLRVVLPLTGILHLPCLIHPDLTEQVLLGAHRCYAATQAMMMTLGSANLRWVVRVHLWPLRQSKVQSMSVWVWPRQQLKWVWWG